MTDCKTVNPFVGGSSPPRGAILHKGFQANPFFYAHQKPLKSRQHVVFLSAFLQLLTHIPSVSVTVKGFINFLIKGQGVRKKSILIQ